MCVPAAWFSPLNLGTIAVVASLFFKAPFINRWQHASKVSLLCLCKCMFVTARQHAGPALI